MMIFESRLYQYFFCALSLYICSAPVFILEDPRDKWELTHYNLVENVCYLLLVDPLLALIFIGPKRLMRGLYYSHEILSSLALIGLSWVSDCLTPNKGQSFARSSYMFFLIYSAMCFSKITRIFNTVLRELPQVKAVFSVMASLRPFLQNLFGMLVCLFLVFGQIGINSYGGIVNSNTPTTYLKATGSPLPKDYHKINFNDFPNSMVTLFNIFMRNSWTQIMNMYLVNTTTTSFRYYFIIFQIIANILISNLIIGFIVEVILMHLNKKYTKYIKIDNEMLNKMKKEEVYDDSSEEVVDEEDVYVDDEAEIDLEDKAKALALAFNKGLEKNLNMMGVTEKKLDRKAEEQIEKFPLI